MKLFDEVQSGIKKAIFDSAEELTQSGFSEAQPVAEKIFGKVVR